MIAREMHRTFDCVGGPLCGVAVTISAGARGFRHWDPGAVGMLLCHTYIVSHDCAGLVLRYAGVKSVTHAIGRRAPEYVRA